MLGPKRSHRWIAMATAALLSCAPLYVATAAITPPKVGGCKPLPDEPPADGKEKVTNPSPGGKGGTRPAGEKPGKSSVKTL